MPLEEPGTRLASPSIHLDAVLAKSCITSRFPLKKKPSSMMPKQTKYELPPFTWWLMHTNYPLHVQVQGVTFAREVKI